MNQIISVTACSLLVAFATAGYGQSMQGASQSKAEDPPESSLDKASNQTDTHQTKPNDADDKRSTDSTDSRRNADSRKNSIEAGDGRSTATSSGGASKDASDGDPDGGRSPNGGRVVHPNEP